MALTDAQRNKISQNRKSNPPSFYNSETGEYESISGETEDALILIGSEVKQKAAQYLDLLLEANPSRGDYDTITARAATKQIENLTAALTELEPVISNFENFRDDLLGGGVKERIFTDGMRPLVRSLIRGIGPLQNKIDASRFSKKVNTYAEAKYASELTDSARKEWRSWKRVLLAYPT